jgi:hypothetical protein
MLCGALSGKWTRQSDDRVQSLFLALSFESCKIKKQLENLGKLTSYPGLCGESGCG